uniref:Protein Abitram n=1 Tax=Mesovelia mulsanti TaxID=236398 RepID=A0A4U8VD22_9HEMI|nr:simiate [Mesovelia mulsanti]
MDELTSPIEKCLETVDEFKPLVDRYFTKFYCLNVLDKQDDYCILMHSNRVCLITLAPSHPIISGDRTVVKLDFQVGGKVDRLSNKVSGKWKHGAQRLKPKSAILQAECSDGKKFIISSSISGKLIEVNQSILKNPNLIKEDAQGHGYIAIVMPDINVADNYREQLLSHEDYEKLVLANSTNGTENSVKPSSPRTEKNQSES